MKWIFLFFIAACYPQLSNAQNDTLKNLKDSVLIKGFYKNYQEFVNNKPSININFSTKLFAVSKDDPTIVRAEFAVIDTTELFGDFWGFCDGQNVFVASGGFFELKYWKLQCRGPNPYLFYSRNKVVFLPGVGGLIAAATSLTIPRAYELRIIDKNGRCEVLTDFNMKHLLSDNKELLRKYKDDFKTGGETAIDYIIKYNEWKLNQ